MPPISDNIDIERLATVISSLVLDVAVVEFSSFDRGSLSVAVIKKMRRKVDKKTKLWLKRIWDRNESCIRDRVEELLCCRYGTIKKIPDAMSEISEVSVGIAKTSISQKVSDGIDDDTHARSPSITLDATKFRETPKSSKNFLIYDGEDDREARNDQSHVLSDQDSSPKMNSVLETRIDLNDSFSPKVSDVEHDDHACVRSSSTGHDVTNVWDTPKSRKNFQTYRSESDLESPKKLDFVISDDDPSPEGNFLVDNSEESSSDSVSGYIEPAKSPAMQKKFSEALGNIQIPSAKIRDEDGNIDNDKIRHEISEAMLNVLRYCCPLSFYGGIRPNLESLVTYAKCRYVSHVQNFRFDITDFEKPISRIYFSSSKCEEIVHDGPKIHCTLKGKARVAVKTKLRNIAPRTLQLETAKNIDLEIAQDGHMQDLMRLSTYQKAKSEENCKNDTKLRSNDLSDLFQQHVVESSSSDPYIRYTGLPLYVHMYSAEQLNVVGPEDIIVHFDSTGSVVRKPVDVKCKRIMYYAMVINKNGSLIPIAEMVSSEHDVASISIFLKRYRYFSLTQSVRWPIFRVVVVDWSWALINSVLNEWNMMSVREYLKKAYTCVLSEINPDFNLIIVQSCCAHFQKRVSSNIQKDFQKFLHLKTFILECMGLMIHCSEIAVLDEVFEEFMTVLVSKERNQAELSIARLHELHVRVTGISMGSHTTEENCGDQCVSEPMVEDTVTGKVSTDSPFFNHFFTKLGKIKDGIFDRDICNKYFAPEIADYITIRYMPFVPMWSALLLKLVTPNISRLSNANVECHFNLVKKQVLNNQVSLKVGRFVKKMKDYTSQLCAEVAIETPIKRLRSKRHTRVRPNKESPNNPLVQEMWKRKRKAQFSHFEGRSLGRIAKKVKTTSFVTSTPKENTVDHEQSLLNKSDSSTHANALANGLFHDVDYYMKVKHVLFTIGRYSSTVCAPVVGFDEFSLFSKEFQTLDGSSWLDGEVIDCFSVAKLSNWKNVIYIPTKYTSYLLGDNCKLSKDESWRMYNIGEQLSGTIAMPYLYQSHWCLLVIDTIEGTLQHLDPRYAKGPDNRRACNAFKEYVAQCAAVGRPNRLCGITWREKRSKTARPMQSIHDGSNCGLYVLHYLECIGLNREYDLQFKPESYRNEVAESLITLSHDMRDICQYCFSRRETYLVMCSTCRRWAHQSCIKRQLDIEKTEDEWNQPTAKYRCPLCNHGIRHWMRY